MTVKTKLGLGYGYYIGEDEIYFPTMPSIFDTTPEDVDGNSNPVSDKSSDPKTNDFTSCDSSDKSSSPNSVESSVFSPRVAESESNLKTAAQEDISFNNNTPSVSYVKDDKHSSFGCNKNGLRHGAAYYCDDMF
ncbi:hypothetical protein Tco_0450603 [Tanacetum coccineum]